MGDAQIANSLMPCTSGTCDGGIFYLRGSDQRFTIKEAQIFDVNIKGNGGIIYSKPPVGGKVHFQDVSDSVFKDFSALLKGSFMYLAGTATFNLTMNSTQFTCSSTGGFGVDADLQKVL